MSASRADNEDQASEGTSRGLDARIDSLERRRAAKEERRNAGELRGQRVRSNAEKLLTRTMSGFIYAALCVACLYFGPISTAALMAAMAWLSCSEFYRLTRMCGRAPEEVLGLTAAVTLPFCPLVSPRVTLIALAIYAIALGAWYVMSPRANIADLAVSAFGPLYCGLMLSFIVMVRMIEPRLAGGLLTLAVMGGIWASDAFAYLVGSRFGKSKLAPRISPNKTWEGLIGGFVGSLIVWVVYFFVGLIPVPLYLCIIISLVSAVCGVVGDLVESRFKRGAGVKDSGDFMPGHGGMLDRSDSLMFGCMAAAVVLMLGGIL